MIAPWVGAGQLDRLLAALEARRPLRDAVPVLPGRGARSVDEWLSEVRAARAAADNAAIAHRARLDDLSRELFGTTLADLIPRHDVELIRSSVCVDVPAAAQLSDLVPALAGISIPGPPPPSKQHVRTRIGVTVTRPPKPVATVVRLHGGAFWMGGGEVPAIIDGRVIDHVVATANVTVADVDYRLAPEHPYPAAIIDTLCVLDAVRNGVAGPAEQIGLWGISSGANTAALAATADAARAPATQVRAAALVVPSMLLSGAPAALRDDPESWRARQHQLRSYLGPEVPAGHPWVSPAAADAVSGLPRAFLGIARHDEIVAGAHRWAEKARASGVAVEAHEYDMTHVVAPPQVEGALADDVAQFFRRAFARPDGGGENQG